MTHWLILVWFASAGVFLIFGQLIAAKMKVFCPARFEALGNPSMLNRFGGSFVAYIMKPGKFEKECPEVGFYVWNFRLAVLLMAMTTIGILIS